MGKGRTAKVEVWGGEIGEVGEEKYGRQSMAGGGLYDGIKVFLGSHLDFFISFINFGS